MIHNLVDFSHSDLKTLRQLVWLWIKKKHPTWKLYLSEVDYYFFYLICMCISMRENNVMLCAIWYHFYNLKNVKNTHGAVLPVLKLQASTSNATKKNTSPWGFCTFLKLYEWCQITKKHFNNSFETFTLHSDFTFHLLPPTLLFICLQLKWNWVQNLSKVV